MEIISAVTVVSIGRLRVKQGRNDPDKTGFISKESAQKIRESSSLIITAARPSKCYVPLSSC